GLVREGRLARITGFIPDRPGELRRVLHVIAMHKCNVVDVIHDRTDPAIPPWHAKVSIVLEAPTREALLNVLRELEASGYKFTRG
ncbi:MAG TPA: ACT domain-containing protein, partial [Pyrodictium sp.]|nr:ACT domain-containing protein [Pyrodictium sp.]